MSFNFDNKNIIKNMYKGSFGIEKESLRVQKDGFLAHTAHPFGNNPHIDRDFCENQVEIVTDVFYDTSSAFSQLSELHNNVIKKLNSLETGGEILWLFSNPPYVKSENDIPIASFKGSLKGKEIYRKYLAEKYGKKKMLFSGIHFNFSFADELIECGFKESKSINFADYKNSLYLELAKKMTKYSWLIVYLTDASPIMDGSYFDDSAIGKDVVTPFSSARCSEIGYWNEFTPILNYDSLESYVGGIQQYIADGDNINIEKEPVQATKSRYLKERLSQPIVTKTALTHIRYATIGNIEYKNCHPYSKADNSSRRWTLIHNGTIFDYPPLCKFIKKQTGDTDSERILLYIIEQINNAQKATKNPLNAIERFSLLDGIVTNMSKENKLNLLIFDGEYMYAHTNYADSLHYLESDNGVIFSTLPLSDEGWKNLPMNTLFALKDGRLTFSGTNHRNEFFDNEETLKYLYQIFSDL